LIYLQTSAPAEIPSVWPLVERMIEDALDYGTSRLSGDDVYEFLCDGTMQLWTAWDEEGIKAFCLTEVCESPRAKWLSIFACAGENYERWVEYLSEIEAWARELNCDFVEMYARPGWKKVLTDYRTRHVQLEKRL